MTVLDRSILTLDLGTKTGWAFHSNAFQIVPSSGMEDFSTKRIEGAGMRYLKFQNWLYSMKETLPPQGINEIYFEEVHHNGMRNSSEVYGGFLGILTSWCEKEKIPYQGVHVATIKKHITGKGNATKQMVIDALYARGYDEIEDDNEADAMALMLYVRERPSGRNEKVS